MSEDPTLLLKKSLVEGSPHINALSLLASNGEPIAYVPENYPIFSEIDIYVRILRTLHESMPKFHQVDITLSDNRHIIILRTTGNKYIVCKTQQNPNLGRIYLVLRSLAYRLGGT
ncbi:MAG: hypothetical protein DRJ66_03730 [Thermoprotei archaeon]|nr:MAG: hypothetical protein DRJ66_03730 [Thermoprotei archaeon]RLF18105.1 MAG: hypothetical protein DRZ82_08845 [Thermoprotei archaeon]